MPRRTAEAGFTLIEVLVALAVFGLAVMALLNLAGQNTRSLVAVSDRTLAAVVAENRAVEAAISPEPPARGRQSGREVAGDRPWLWTRTVTPTADAGILRVDVRVSPEGGRRTVAEVTMFRGTP